MIDTLHLHLSIDLIIDNYQKKFQHLFSGITTKIDQQGITDSAKYKNFMVMFNQTGIYLYGSLAKYYLGTNQTTLRLVDIDKAINQLSQELSLPLYKAKVNRVDLAENIITEHPVSMYFNLLGEKRYFERLELNKNIAYKNGNRYILFYDKIKEIKRYGEDPNYLLNERNVLRVEYRFLKHKSLRRYLGLEVVTVEDIIFHYEDLIKAWYDTINTIDKYRNKIQFEPSIFLERGLFDAQMKLIGIEEIGGMKTIANMVKIARQEKLFTHSNQASNILNKYKGLMATPKLTIKSPLINELEKKISITYFVHSRSAQY